MRLREEPRWIVRGDLRLDCWEGELVGPAGRAHLTPHPARMLAFLLTFEAERFATHDILLDAVWGASPVPPKRGLVSVYICKLRAALRMVRSRLRIKTVRGAGYRLEDPAPSQRLHVAVFSTDQMSALRHLIAAARPQAADAARLVEEALRA